MPLLCPVLPLIPSWDSHEVIGGASAVEDVSKGKKVVALRSAWGCSTTSVPDRVWPERGVRGVEHRAHLPWQRGGR